MLGKDINNADDIAVQGQLLFDLSDKGSLLLNGR